MLYAESANLAVGEIGWVWCRRFSSPVNSFANFTMAKVWLLIFISQRQAYKSNVIIRNVIFKSQSFAIGELPSNVTRTEFNYEPSFAVVGLVKGGRACFT